MGYPRDPKLKGLAAVTYRPEHLSWEYDIRAVMPESDEVPRVSDWHRRHGRANRKDGNIERAAAALPTATCGDEWPFRSCFRGLAPQPSATLTLPPAPNAGWRAALGDLAPQ